MNVLHVTLSFSRGGRRQAITALCRGLAAQGVRNHLCCIDTFGASAAERAAIFTDGIALERRRLFDRDAIRRLRQYCREHAIDVVHTHDAGSQFCCLLALPWRRPALLMSFHRSRDFESARWRDRLRNAIAGWRTGAVVAASRSRQQHYRESNWIAARKVLCIPFGIDLTRFRPDAARREAQRARLRVPADRLLIGSVGHFGAEKGIDLAIEAFQRVVRAHPEINAEMLILGEGSADNERFVRARVAPEFSARIHFEGFQAEPECWLSAFDVFLHGARREAFGLVVVEAMACGVAVVATPAGSVPDLLRDGELGSLAGAITAEALADALLSLLELPDRGRALSEAAVTHARANYGQERCANRYATLYADLHEHLATGPRPT